MSRMFDIVNVEGARYRWTLNENIDEISTYLFEEVDVVCNAMCANLAMAEYRR